MNRHVRKVSIDIMTDVFKVDKNNNCIATDLEIGPGQIEL
jgi:hypothetical protein